MSGNFVVVSCKKQMVSPKQSFLSSLALRFPFVFNFWGREAPESEDHVAAQSTGDPCPSGALSPSNIGDMPVVNPDENFDVQSEELETVFGNSFEGASASRCFFSRYRFVQPFKTNYYLLKVIKKKKNYYLLKE